MADPADALRTVGTEMRYAGDLLAAEHADQVARLADTLRCAPRVFVHGLGRSGLALRMTAMRLMHLGLTVHVVGETTTPAIRRGDVLLVASGSGSTESVVRTARAASDHGARVVVITADEDSPLATLSGVVVSVRAAGKLDRSAALSSQYAGSLFEQLVVVVGDAVFHALWTTSGLAADDLWSRHSNLE